MLKLGEAVKKDNVDLIVAFLNWSGAKEEDMVVSDEIEQARREFAAKNHDDDVTGSKSDLSRNLCAATSIGDDGSPVKIIDDDVEDISCKLLNNRQKFLEFCISNDLQFDECRRAKQTSLLLL
jgi:E1A/CREB-binding protein